MNIDLINYISYLLCIKIERVERLTGGDVSKIFLLITETERFLCKLNLSSGALALFESEQNGLRAIAATKTISTPKILHCEGYENGAFLILEYIAPKPPSAKDFELLGHHLAALHQNGSAQNFGWPTNNHIGNLQQSNLRQKNWFYFYAQERLLPQLKIAADKHLLDLGKIPSENQILKSCSELLPKTKPTLLHGDLWSGNFLVDTKGVPYLIDPAVYYGHSEVDIAMTKLFGGFSPKFYEAYHEHFPISTGFNERIDLYQLYYLLVHLNMFGASYATKVLAILKTYF